MTTSTAIIAGAALLNARDLVDKDMEDSQLVVNGAGAGAIAGTLQAIKTVALLSKIE